jgi:hypothetical protein
MLLVVLLFNEKDGLVNIEVSTTVPCGFVTVQLYASGRALPLHTGAILLFVVVNVCGEQPLPGVTEKEHDGGSITQIVLTNVSALLQAFFSVNVTL